MAGQGGSEELVFRMVLDPGDLKQVIGPGAVAGAAGGAGGMMGGGGGMVPQKGQAMPLDEPIEVSPDPSFMSIFKPLAYMMILGKTLGMIAMNSAVANTYLGAMGKMFGAAIDLIMLPLTPIFNVVLVVMAKLLAWLVTSGILEKMYVVFSRSAEYLELAVGWIQEVYTAIKEFDLPKLAELIIGGMKAAITQTIKDPAGMAGAIGSVAVGGLVLKGMAKMLFGLGGMGGGGAAAGGAAKAGMLSRFGLPALGVGIGAGVSYYGWGNAGKEGGAGWGGVGTMAAGGALAGGVIGSVVPGVGTAVGAGIGGLVGGGIGLGKKMGWWGGGGQESAGGSQNLENVGNTSTWNITFNETQNTDEIWEKLQEFIDEESTRGYDVKTRSY